jgi:Skp family chaperone for outer membrane proteins
MREIKYIAALLFACAGVAASAQTFGPPIEGVCLLSRAGAIDASSAGRSLQARLTQMQTSLNGELAQRRAVLDQQRRALEGRRNTIAPVEYQRQSVALENQAQMLDQQQNRRFIAAQTRGQQQIDRALGQALSLIITRNACSLVMERDNSYGWNNAMDITAAVSREMDSILRTVDI